MLCIVTYIFNDQKRPKECGHSICYVEHHLNGVLGVESLYQLFVCLCMFTDFLSPSLSTLTLSLFPECRDVDS